MPPPLGDHRGLPAPTPLALLRSPPFPLPAFLDPFEPLVPFWLFSWLRILERAHHQFELGNISESSWAGQASHAKSVLAAPAVQRFWEARRSAFSVEFQEFVDSSQPVRASLSPHEAMATFRGEPTAAHQGDEADVE